MLENELLSLDAQIANLVKELKEKEDEIEQVKLKIEKMLPAKIYTRKELEQMKEEERQKRLEKLKYERENIDLITQKSFVEADKMRERLKNSSDEEKKEIETAALEIEIQALEKKLKVKDDIIFQTEKDMREIMAGKVVRDSKIKHYESELNSENRKNIYPEKETEIRKNIVDLKSINRDALEKYFLLLKKSENIKTDMYVSAQKLVMCRERLKTLV